MSNENPSHYGPGHPPPILREEEVQPIELIEKVSGFRQANQAMTLKYLSRFHLKGTPLQDLKKARWHLDRLIEAYEHDHISE